MSWGRAAMIAISVAGGLHGTAALAEQPAVGLAGGPSDGTPSDPRSSAVDTGNTPVTGGGVTMYPTSRGPLSGATGVVERIDRSHSSLTLRGLQRRVSIGSGTAIVVDGAPASLGDIREGDRLHALFSRKGDDDTPIGIEVIGGPGPSRHG